MNKITLMFAVVCMTTFSYGQQQDSLSLTMKYQAQVIAHMKEELTKCHNEFRTGLILNLSGGLLCLGTTTWVSSTDWSQYENGDMVKGVLWAVSFLAGTSSIVGGVMMIDSHKHIGRAGKWQLKGDKITYSF